MKRLIALWALVAFAPVSFAEKAVDYGDFTSVTLQVKAWEALGEEHYDLAVTYTEKCTELYEDKAREMQATLDQKPSTENVNEYWALNDVGTCYFIRGEALTKLRKYKEAKAAFEVVRDELKYSQCWDPKGWYWSPADAAYARIGMLEARIDGDF